MLKGEDKTKPHIYRLIRKWGVIVAIFFFLFLICSIVLLYAIDHSLYSPTENSFFRSDFVTARNVLVLIPHEDDEINLAYSVIDSFIQAGSNVTIAFTTNGDARTDPKVRIRETVQADAKLGAHSSNLVFLGYGDHIHNPPLFRGDATSVRTSDSGHTGTYGVNRFSDYHSMRFGKPAQYTLSNVQTDIRQLILDLRPDIIFVNDNDDHVDHVSLSIIFDTVMGKLLHEKVDYHPMVFKGFAYDYAWHGNNDFYQIPILSADHAWKPCSYNGCYQWNERVRFVISNQYLSYTLRGSKLYPVLQSYASQNAVAKESNLLNGDKVFWERRTDALSLSGKVTASSGKADLLNDFILEGYADDPLYNCWFPDGSDKNAIIHYSWDKPQDIGEIVFYDAPYPAGDVNAVRVTVNNEEPKLFTLTDTTGMPCRMSLVHQQVSSLSIELAATNHGKSGLFEIEVLPQRTVSTQWIKLKNSRDDFCYELPYPADQELTLSLYGYPTTPSEATATLWKGDQQLTAPKYNGSSFHVQPLHAGRYRLCVVSGSCTDEVILRIGDSMLWERGLQWLERHLWHVLSGNM